MCLTNEEMGAQKLCFYYFLLILVELLYASLYRTAGINTLLCCKLLEKCLAKTFKYASHLLGSFSIINNKLTSLDCRIANKSLSKLLTSLQEYKTYINKTFKIKYGV